MCIFQEGFFVCGFYYIFLYDFQVIGFIFGGKRGWDFGLLVGEFGEQDRQLFRYLNSFFFDFEVYEGEFN